MLRAWPVLSSSRPRLGAGGGGKQDSPANYVGAGGGEGAFETPLRSTHAAAVAGNNGRFALESGASQRPVKRLCRGRRAGSVFAAAHVLQQEPSWRACCGSSRVTSISSDSQHKMICRERVVRGRDVIMRVVAQECFMEDVKGGMKRARSAAISSRGFSVHLVWLLIR